MKLSMLAFVITISLTAYSQQDTVATDVYKSKEPAKGNKHILLHGSTLDLADLTIYTITLAPGKSNSSAISYPDKEQLIIVKNGTLKLTVAKQEGLLGAGGLALVVAGDEQRITNMTSQPATYYVINYTAKDAVNIERGQRGGGSFIVDWKDMVVKQTEKGQSRPIFDRPSSMFPHFDVHATTLNPGISSHAAHTHRVEEIILKISGNGKMQLGEKFKNTAGGDVVFVNSMVPHAITNIGNKPCTYFAIQWHHN